MDAGRVKLPSSNGIDLVGHAEDPVLVLVQRSARMESPLGCPSHSGLRTVQCLPLERAGTRGSDQGKFQTALTAVFYQRNLTCPNLGLSTHRYLHTTRCMELFGCQISFHPCHSPAGLSTGSGQAQRRQRPCWYTEKMWTVIHTPAFDSGPVRCNRGAPDAS